MTFGALVKTSPLSGVYRNYPVQFRNIAGWQMADHFGNPELERQRLQSGSVLADWSHVGKLSISGKTAAECVETLCPGAGAIAPLTSHQTHNLALLRLTPNDYLLLCPAGEDATLMQQFDSPAVTLINQTGAMGCFALGGAGRDAVLERSTALNLRRDRIHPGSVLQTTVHTIRCTLYRTHELEILLHPRSLSESLFNALLDVGIGLGLVPTGLAILPVQPHLF